MLQWLHMDNYSHNIYKCLVGLSDHFMKWHKMLWAGRELKSEGVWLNTSFSGQCHLKPMPNISEFKVPLVWPKNYIFQNVLASLLK